MQRPKRSQVFKKTSRTVKDALLYYLALRDHTEKELSQKLSKRYAADEIKDIIEWAKNMDLIPNDEASEKRLAKTLRDSYSRRKKSSLWINQKLRSIGLPSVSTEEASEEENIGLWIEKKYNLEDLQNRENQNKCLRFLATKGFSLSLSRKVLNEKLKGS